ncbi:hypothetical protein [Asticcacaulis sp. AC402]|uniref:hypothetical protein n=1 Tax=Asticcacaulis sp. AC402 TaxID=1282361 RepID=UPI0003C3C563|nr:hypothetical protein [Asticcacaulis sp. AC402]ESQ75091.1 hypothetical protein ABAC402_10510 [Asticcacaulis sp. AC402]
MTPRVTVCIRPDGSFELLCNEAGRDLLVENLQQLDRRNDHFHLDYYADPDVAGATDVILGAVPYHAADTVVENGKVLLRPDDWDREFYPHVMTET